MLVKIVWRRFSSPPARQARVVLRIAKRGIGLLILGITLILAVGLTSLWAWPWWSAKRALRQASLLIDEARYTEAVDALTQFIRQYPGSTAYRLRAVAYGKLGDDAKTIADLTTVIDQEPADGWAYQRRAEIFIRHLKYAEAAEDLNNALRLSPNWVQGYAIRGETYRVMGRLDDAMDDMNMAVALQPIPENYYKRGVVLASLRDYSKAIVDFTIALSLNPHLVDAYRARAGAREGIGDTEGAQADLRHAASAVQ